nr:cytochrome P450 [Kibdelosporangium sp. MJ126-NF4]CEL13399.1 putative cytochrome P450 hydroxylase [Kibdelosporangium sp. MJ126-NF4]CTQ99088.1 putative cytochrome P450 hydroxylase [Kibdelosporangium sp. MJ126-NF4]
MTTTEAQPGSTGFAFNPFTPEFIENPYPYYAMMRAKEPVHLHPLGFWVLARHQDVRSLLRSGHSVDERNEAPSPFQELRQAGRGSDFTSVLNRSMLNVDPDDHTRLRRLVSAAFNGRSILGLKARMTEIVDGMLDQIADAGRTDIVKDFAYPLAFSMICELLGMPETDHVALRELLEVIARSAEPVVDPELLGRISTADREFSQRMADVIATKRRHQDDSLLSDMIRAEHEGDKLTEDELIAQVATLYLAGYESTVNLIANGVIALLRNPDQHRLLTGRPDLDANAVEEFLRYDTSVQQVRRITLAPHLASDGQEIPPNSFVLGLVGSANRDEAAFGPDAGKLRVDRPNAKEHLSFGDRTHYCLGAALGRVQAQLAVGRLVRRFPRLQLTEEVTWKTRVTVRASNAVRVAIS